MSTGLRFIVLAAAIVAIVMSGSPAPAEEPSVATTVSEESYGSFLDSLRTRSDTVDREGVRPEWPVADSLSARVIDEGPSRVGTLADTRPIRRRVHRDFVPALTTYNRVEGLRLGGDGRFTFGRATLSAGVGYGFSNERWRHREELRLDAGRYGEFRGGYSDLIEPYGAAPVPGNAFYAFIGGADDQDYLLRRAANVRWQLGEEKRFIGVGYEVADERNVAAATDWNLFGRNRGPRPNPPITEGRGRRLRIEGGLTGVVPALRGTLFRLSGEVEIAGYGLGGDFEYDRYRLELVSDWHAIARDDVRIVLAAGGARNLGRGDLRTGGPVTQSLFYLGGPKALRAYPVHALSGDRFAFGSLDYLIGTDPLARLGIPWAQIQFVPFFEIGAAWLDPEGGRRVFSRPESSDWRSDAGLGFQRNILLGISARVDLAYRLDRASDRLTTRVSFTMPLFDRFDSE